MAHKCAVLIPIYRERPTDLELFNLSVSLVHLSGFPIYFVCPEGLDVVEYEQFYADKEFVRFDRGYFLSNKTYSRLCLSEDFYERFSAHDKILILQTDAIVLNDSLIEWSRRNFDYIGAPLGVPIRVNDPSIVNEILPYCSGYCRGLPVGSVGNGGLSLRDVRNTLEILRRHRKTVARFVEASLPEDIFYTYAGMCRYDYKIPRECVASLFAVEMNGPAYIDHNKALPFGVHGWDKHDRAYWLKLFDKLGFGSKLNELDICR
jgi:hypothetical protein